MLKEYTLLEIICKSNSMESKWYINTLGRAVGMPYKNSYIIVLVEDIHLFEVDRKGVAFPRFGRLVLVRDLQESYFTIKNCWHPIPDGYRPVKSYDQAEPKNEKNSDFRAMLIKDNHSSLEWYFMWSTDSWKASNRPHIWLQKISSNQVSIPESSLLIID